uniref:immunoglobulin superfamily member 1-like n=1 Tax=Phascolarctos cinereus TaxID=38626 RepID=UPI000A289FA3|nr:immunoglobulin superfamily member 1-like [Phascolarctos cinereus]
MVSLIVSSANVLALGPPSMVPSPPPRSLFIIRTFPPPQAAVHLARVRRHPAKEEPEIQRQLPRPTLWAQPGFVVAPGANITLWLRPLQQQASAELWTSFLIPYVRPEDTGSYSCSYRERKVSSRGSEPSEALELLVPGSLPKPSLSALLGLVVEPRMHVTPQCRQPHQSSLWRVTFTLLKMGTPKPLQSQNSAGTSAAFPFLSVRAQDAGNHSCVYHRRVTSYQVSEPSEVLEILVTGALVGSCPTPSCPELKTRPPLSSPQLTPFSSSPIFTSQFPGGPGSTANP